MNNRHALLLFIHAFVNTHQEWITVYHITQVQLPKACSRQRANVHVDISLQTIYAAVLLNVFGIDTNNDDNRVHPEHFCPSCK